MAMTPYEKALRRWEDRLEERLQALESQATANITVQWGTVLALVLIGVMLWA